MRSWVQGCQMVSFQIQNTNFGKFWRALDWKMSVHIFYNHLEHFTATRNTLWSLCHAVIILYLFHRFGILCQEKSGNPVRVDCRQAKGTFHSLCSPPNPLKFFSRNFWSRTGSSKTTFLQVR
jgi:hypothetical protein